MEGTKAQTPRNLTFDVLNILACLGVIALHHNGLVHTFDGGTRGWVQSLVVECVCYCSVPLFMMISGANLLGYRDKYDTGTFFKKRATRTVLPWLAWSVIFLFWKLRTGEIVLQGDRVKDALLWIFNFKVESVYWFFGELFAAYLAIPVLSAIRKERRLLWYVALLYFIFLGWVPILKTWLHFSWLYKEPSLGNLTGFVVLGYLLSTEELSGKQRRWLYVLGAAGLLLRFFYTWHFSLLSGVTDTSIKGYSRFHSVLYACAVFVLALRIPWARILPGWLKKALPALSGCSFGVFLIHRMVMRYEMAWLGLGNSDLVWRLPCILLTYCLSLLIVAGIKKIPILKVIVG